MILLMMFAAVVMVGAAVGLVIYDKWQERRR